MLTLRMKQALEYIQFYQNEWGITPSYDEMRNALGLHSKSGVHRLILALEERGFIRRLKHRARAIEVIPDTTHRWVRCEHCGKLTVAKILDKPVL